jgi:hypothetical protein
MICVDMVEIHLMLYGYGSCLSVQKLSVSRAPLIESLFYPLTYFRQCHNIVQGNASQFRNTVL